MDTPKAVLATYGQASLEELFLLIGFGDRFGEMVEERLHRSGVDLRQDQGEGVIRLDFGGGEDVGEGEALVGRARRTLPFDVPAMAHAAFLADARLVLEKDAQPLIRVFTDDFPQGVRSPF